MNALEVLRQEIEYYESMKTRLASLLDDNSSSSSSSFNNQQKQIIEDEIIKYEKQLNEIQENRTNIRNKRSKKMKQLTKLRDMMERVDGHTNALLTVKSQNEDSLSFVENELNHCTETYRKLSSINVLNDAFHIWFTGPYGMINGCRLGRSNIVEPEVKWAEINAALGFAVLAISTMAMKIAADPRNDFHFTRYVPVPLGSFSKIAKADDLRTMLNLYSDGNFGIFAGKRAFNSALIGFLSCVEELGVFVSSRDPTLSIPYPITPGEGRVGGLSISIGTAAGDETWTKALKYMLTDIKWIIAWVSKHQT